MKKVLLLLPFLFFLIGFMGTSFLMRREVFPTPRLVGMSVADAVVLLSDYQLNARVLEQKENADVAPGTVLSQIPQAGRQVKHGQQVFLVVTRKPAHIVAPAFVDLSSEKVKEIAREKALRLRIVELADTAPRGMVIAQFPSAGVELPDRMMTLYVSTGSGSSHSIMPSFVGKRALDVLTALCEQGITVDEEPEELARGDDTRIVKEQRPLAGTLLTSLAPRKIRLLSGL